LVDRYHVLDANGKIVKDGKKVAYSLYVANGEEVPNFAQADELIDRHFNSLSE
jgi:hypothetical protein